MKTNLWLDCDTGNDDAFAIILAGHNPKLNLLGISTVFGNSTVHNTTKNTLKINAISGLSHIKVFKGAQRPLLRPLNVSAGQGVHGESGIGNGLTLPEAKSVEQQMNAVQGMYASFKKMKNKGIIAATGALTNIALLIHTFPEILEKIEKIIIMGGGVIKGNVTEHAEYNFYQDPEAASIVFNSNVKVKY